MTRRTLGILLFFLAALCPLAYMTLYHIVFATWEGVGYAVITGLSCFLVMVLLGGVGLSILKDERTKP